MDVSRRAEGQADLSKLDVSIRGYGVRPELSVAVRHLVNPDLPVPWANTDIEDFDISSMSDAENWGFSFQYHDVERPHIAFMDLTSMNIACAIRHIEEHIVGRWFLNTVFVELPMKICFYKEDPGFAHAYLIMERTCRV